MEDRLAGWGANRWRREEAGEGKGGSSRHGSLSIILVVLLTVMIATTTYHTRNGTTVVLTRSP